jgi:hypothetical protein
LWLLIITTTHFTFTGFPLNRVNATIQFELHWARFLVIGVIAFRNEAMLE